MLAALLCLLSTQQAERLVNDMCQGFAPPAACPGCCADAVSKQHAKIRASTLGARHILCTTEHLLWQKEAWCLRHALLTSGCCNCDRIRSHVELFSTHTNHNRLESTYDSAVTSLLRWCAEFALPFLPLTAVAQKGVSVVDSMEGLPAAGEEKQQQRTTAMKLGDVSTCALGSCLDLLLPKQVLLCLHIHTTGKRRAA